MNNTLCKRRVQKLQRSERTVNLQSLVCGLSCGEFVRVVWYFCFLLTFLLSETLKLSTSEVLARPFIALVLGTVHNSDGYLIHAFPRVWLLFF